VTVATLAQYFPFALAIVGTLALSLAGFSKYREKRVADMLEATTTWRSLAESRQAMIFDLRQKVTTLDRENADLRNQVAYYWGEVQAKRPGSLPPPGSIRPAESPPEEMP
jgi:hypothetical protein